MRPRGALYSGVHCTLGVAEVSSKMESGGRKERGEMSAFEAFAAARKALRRPTTLCVSLARPLFVLVSSSGNCSEAYEKGADVAVCHDNTLLSTYQGRTRE